MDYWSLKFSYDFNYGDTYPTARIMRFSTFDPSEKIKIYHLWDKGLEEYAKFLTKIYRIPYQTALEYSQTAHYIYMRIWRSEFRSIPEIPFILGNGYFSFTTMGVKIDQISSYKIEYSDEASGARSEEDYGKLILYTKSGGKLSLQTSIKRMKNFHAGILEKLYGKSQEEAKKIAKKARNSYV